MDVVEEFDVLDENGNKTGEKQLRSIVHKTGLWHRTVHVWFYRLNVNKEVELLLQKRAPNKPSFPNMWDISSAGHITTGDNSKEAAIREVQEELGLTLTEKELGNPLFIHKSKRVLNNGTYLDNEFQDVFLLHKDVAIKDIVIQVEELSEVRWMLMSDVKEKWEKKRRKFCDSKLYRYFI